LTQDVFGDGPIVPIEPYLHLGALLVSPTSGRISLRCMSGEASA